MAIDVTYKRVLFFDIKRRIHENKITEEHTHKQYHLDANETVSSCLQCNTTIYILTIHIQQKTHDMYCIKYISKNSLKLTNALTLRPVQ